MNPFFAFVLTFFEAILTLVGIRSVYRFATGGWRRVRGRHVVAGEVASAAATGATNIGD